MRDGEKLMSPAVTWIGAVSSSGQSAETRPRETCAKCWWSLLCLSSSEFVMVLPSSRKIPGGGRCLLTASCRAIAQQVRLSPRSAAVWAWRARFSNHLFLSEAMNGAMQEWCLFTVWNASASHRENRWSTFAQLGIIAEAAQPKHGGEWCLPTLVKSSKARKHLPPHTSRYRRTSSRSRSFRNPCITDRKGPLCFRCCQVAGVTHAFNGRCFRGPKAASAERLVYSESSAMCWWREAPSEGWKVQMRSSKVLQQVSSLRFWSLNLKRFRLSLA
mmetsp:Transcript_96778/g.191863  ORF Transcript_96778/g.191863 Transcript_96778/m.191863 type:complete len:273 (+) Transcript_96778:482-1300(+)